MSTPSNDIATVLELLADGLEASAVQLTALSSMDADDSAAVRAAWGSLPAATRERVMSRACDLAEDDPALDFVPLARSAMGDASPMVRRRAAETLWETDDRRVAADLIGLLESDPDEAVRGAAADSLMNFVLLYELGQFHAGQGRDVVAALRHRVEDPDESIDVRARALESLGSRSEPWVDSLITNAYYHDDRRMQLAAVHGMGASADDKWLEYIYEVIGAEDPELRFEAVTAAGSIGAEEATDSVALLLQDEDTEVALAAVRALGEISGPRAIEYLQALRGEAPEGFGDEIEAALEEAVFGMQGRADEDELD